MVEGSACSSAGRPSRSRYQWIARSMSLTWMNMPPTRFFTGLVINFALSLLWQHASYGLPAREPHRQRSADYPPVPTGSSIDSALRGTILLLIGDRTTYGLGSV